MATPAGGNDTAEVGRTIPRVPGELTRGARVWRVSLTAVWLIYLIQPVSGLFGHHRSALYIAGGMTIIAAFCVVFVAMIADWNGAHQRSSTALAGLAALFALALAACIIYGGSGATSLWIYVSAVAGLVTHRQQIAIWAVALSTVCYCVTSWTSHVGMGDFLINLLPTVLLGLAMIGLRSHFELTRELSEARETVARMAASQERLRLARDMHDLTGQSLSMITLKSELALRLLGRLPAGPDRDRARDEIEQVGAVSRQTLHDIREAISGYRRPTLAVEIITARAALEAAGITPHDDAELTLLSGTFDPDAEAALAWCLREAVTNVVRHSGARTCSIGLTRRGGTLSLEVRDDGRGHPGDEPAGGGTGLRGMSERLCAVGGSLELRPAGQPGFRLIATVPAAAPDAAADTATASTPARKGATVTE
ncbi:MAG TPA: sensor histidine kinase [Trebonia sp.]|jgi:two-component system sensor histidine kinase DesK|nr:sensor histidine kinase [Trebonia sp.]